IVRRKTMAVNYDALINQINAEQAKQEQAAREANALLEKQAAAKRDQLMNTYAAQESNQRRNYNTLVDQADKQLTKDGAAAYQSMLVARNPFGTNAERLRNNGMSEYMNTAAYNTYRGDYNNAKNTRDTNVNNYNIALENYLSELNANRANAQKEYDIALLNAQNELQQQLANLQAQYGQQRLQMQQARAQAEAQAAAQRRTAARRSSSNSKKVGIIGDKQEDPLGKALGTALGNALRPSLWR
ncbi:MAG: hypothetical protein ACLRP7_07800, partial [Christensenellales bacterium]